MCQTIIYHTKGIQFTVLDEDALSELVSFFEDILGRHEAMEEQEVTHSQKVQLLCCPVYFRPARVGTRYSLSVAPHLVQELCVESSC